MRQKRRRIILTCDDCGLSEGINEAALQLHLSGMATTASVMTNLVATSHALRLFADHPSFQVGAHLNLTTGYPLTSVLSPSPITYRDGRFRSKWSLFARSLLPNKRFLELVEDELTRQMEVFFESNIRPTHITTHIQFHLAPSLRKAVFRLARKFQVVWVRAYEIRSVVAPKNPFTFMRESMKPAQEKLLLIPDYLVVAQMWMQKDPKHLVERIAKLDGNIELVVHPGLVGDITFPYDIDSHTPTERYIEMSYFKQVLALLGTQAKHLQIGDLACNLPDFDSLSKRSSHS